MEAVAIILAGGASRRMQVQTKHLLPIPGNPEEPLTQTPLGRIITQLRNAGMTNILVASGENTQALQNYLNTHGLGKIKVFPAARRIGEKTDWKFVFEELSKQLKPNQHGLFIYGDNIYKDSTVNALVRRAGYTSKPFEAFWSFDLFSKKGRKPGMVDETCWIANKTTLEDLAKRGNPFSRYRGLRYVRFLGYAAPRNVGIRISKPVINLNVPQQYKAAQKELTRKPWQVKQRIRK